MKPIRVLAICALSLLPSCTHVTMLGHVAAYDVNAEFKGDPITPVSMNAGFESHSFVAVPPEHSLTLRENLSGDFLPVGDVLPTISRLRIERIKTEAAWKGVAFDFVSSGATGEAAVAAAGGTPKAPNNDQIEVALKDDDKATELAEKLAEEIDKITTDPSSIPTLTP